jgi:cobalt-zinc-cadmium efflux system outer membrane protein
MGKTGQMGRKFVLRVLPLAIVALPMASLFAQPNTDPNHRNRYLLPTPPIPAAQAPAAAPKIPAAKPTAGIAALPKRTMSLAEIGSRTTDNHPGVQQAKRQAEAWRGEWIQAGLKSNPSIEYSAEEMTRDYAGVQGITLNQPITPKYKRDARQAAVSREYQAASQVYHIQHQKAVNDAMLTAYRVAFAYRKCLVLEELTQISQDALHVAGELLQAKEIERAMFLDIKIKSEQTRIALRDAEIAYRTACKELAILLGLPDRELIDITDPVETLPMELNESALLAEIQAVSPELRQAYAEVETAKARLKQQYAEAGIDYDTNVKIAYNTETKQNEFSVGVAIPIRLFDRNQGNIQRAKSELAASYRNVERLERLLAQRYERQMGEYQVARNRVVSYQEILSDAREALDLALAAYRRGEYGSHELLEAEVTFSNVQIEYLDSLYALMESHILLRGALLSGGLEKPETK